MQVLIVVVGGPFPPSSPDSCRGQGNRVWSISRESSESVPQGFQMDSEAFVYLRSKLRMTVGEAMKLDKQNQGTELIQEELFKAYTLRI